MPTLLTTALIAHLISGAMSPPEAPASRPAESPPTSAPADDIRLAARVRELVARLGDRDFAKREAAQRDLAGLGEAAVPLLVPYLSAKDGEVAPRVLRLIGTPRDPKVRVDAALRLMESGDPDWLETGVHMLFERPGEVIEPFMARAAEARGLLRKLLEPVSEQLSLWERTEKLFRRNYERLRETNPEGAARLLRTHETSHLYNAEAAYWGAYEALQDYQEHPPPTSAPAAPSP